MRKIALVTLVVLLGSLLAWAGYIYWRDKRLPTMADVNWVLNQAKPAFSSIQTPGIIQEKGGTAITAISTNATQAAQIAAESINASIQVASDSDKPLTEKALDYARYQYCIQVVEEYEKEQ